MLGFTKNIENIRIALKAIRSQLLRTILTMLIIAVGIAAMVGILTAIDAMKLKIANDFSNMGSNTFSIQNRGMRARHNGRDAKAYPSITFEQARIFKERFSGAGCFASVSMTASGIATIKYKSKKTDPNVMVVGADENYLKTVGYKINQGRNFSVTEIKDGRHVVIIGAGLLTTLFEPTAIPTGKTISIAGGKYRIIGILEEKGNSMGFSGDNQCIIPLINARQYFSRPNMSFKISVKTPGAGEIKSAISNATGIMRVLRKVPPGQENSFEIVQSDSLANMVIEQMSFISIAATVIGLITLMGAAIGLMNIMLVSVTERTKEIGTRKAVGASANKIKQQFLVEAIVISQLGGIIGIILGIIIGNVVSWFVGSVFFIPWNWIILGVVLCLIVGIFSGYYPAQKAAQLDPIDALRHE